MTVFGREPYMTVNTIFAVVLAAALAYFGIFSCTDAYPVSAVTSHPLTSTGMQRALSEWVRLRPASAMEFNKYSLGVFVFIVSQLLMRVGATLFLVISPGRKRTLIITDAVISVLLFLWAFAPMTFVQFRNFWMN